MISDAYSSTGFFDIYDVAFSSATDGVAVGDSGNSGSLVGGGYIYTTDGGKAWSNFRVINGFQSSIGSIAFSSATNGVAGEGYDDDAGRQYSTTIKKIMKNQLGSAGGYDGQYSTTIDGGKTWSSAQAITGLGAGVSNISFSSSTNGFLLGYQGDGFYSGLYSYSTNGGKTWSSAQNISGFGDEGINQAVFSTATNGVALGSNNNEEIGGELYAYTTDGGKTWSNPLQISGMSNITSVAFSSATNGTAIGFPDDNYPVYSYTTDGGHTWSSAQRLPGWNNVTYTPYSFYDITFAK
ncbi:MAG: sialidase family protein [Phycisphaerales bacterium]|nr:sialidase family protein [Phycisphaerales bacterium]